VLNGVLWVLGTGAQWRELPGKYPPFQTCHRRFQQWVRTGKLEPALLARHLHERGQLNLDEAFVDATLAPARKRGALLSAPRGAATARSLFPFVARSRWNQGIRGGLSFSKLHLISILCDRSITFGMGSGPCRFSRLPGRCPVRPLQTLPSFA
jgi:transposase